MSDYSRGSLCLSGVVWPSRWGALPRADASCCFDSSEWLGHHSLSLSLFISISYYLDIKSTCGSKSEGDGSWSEIMTLALWCQAQLRIGMTAGWETVRSQESRRGTRDRGLERGPLYFLSVSQTHMEAALKVFQQNWNTQLPPPPPWVSLLKPHDSFIIKTPLRLSSLVLLNTDEMNS